MDSIRAGHWNSAECRSTAHRWRTYPTWVNRFIPLIGCLGACMLPPVDSRTVIKRIEAEGWQLVRGTGSHHQFRHPSRPGTVAVPHPRKDMPVGTLKSIARQSGVNMGPPS